VNNLDCESAGLDRGDWLKEWNPGAPKLLLKLDNLEFGEVHVLFDSGEYVATFSNRTLVILASVLMLECKSNQSSSSPEVRSPLLDSGSSYSGFISEPTLFSLVSSTDSLEPMSCDPAVVDTAGLLSSGVTCFPCMFDFLLVSTTVLLFLDTSLTFVPVGVGDLLFFISLLPVSMDVCCRKRLFTDCDLNCFFGFANSVILESPWSRYRYGLVVYGEIGSDKENKYYKILRYLLPVVFRIKILEKPVRS
jgi:hypothetical protein